MDAHTTDPAEIWEGLSAESKALLLDSEGSSVRRRHELRILGLARQGPPYGEPGHRPWDTLTKLGRAVSDYGRKAGV